MNDIVLPLSIVNNRRMERWLRFDADRRLRLSVGKVEIGQGVLIALTQIAAEELDIPSTGSTSSLAIPPKPRTRARPVRRSRWRYRVRRCGWFRRRCGRGFWAGWRSG